MLAPPGRPAGWRRSCAIGVTPALTALGWTPRPGEDELTRQLRGDLIRALGTLGNDRGRAGAGRRAYGATSPAQPPSIPTCCPPLIAVLAHAGDAARYAEFVRALPRRDHAAGGAALSLRADRASARPSSSRQTLARTINGEIRTQDAPFVVRAHADDACTRASWRGTS